MPDLRLNLLLSFDLTSAQSCSKHSTQEPVRPFEDSKKTLALR